MPLYQYRAVRKSDGTEIVTGEIDDTLGAGKNRMKLAVMAALLHDHPLAHGLSYDDIRIEMRPAVGQTQDC